MLCLLSTIAYTQPNIKGAKYSMKSVPIVTRWAKEVNPKNVLAEYPRPQMVRANWTNLNGLWEYAIVKHGSNMPVQFDGNILVPFPIESALSGVKKKLDPPASYNNLPVPRNELWYKRKIIGPTLNNGERLLLNFGGVSWQSTVFLNGKEVGSHAGSYTSFVIDVTDYIHQGNNEITVKVTNPLDDGIGPRGKQTKLPGLIWYTPSSGIWQTVWLEKVPANYITSLKITPDVDHSQVRITVNTLGSSDVLIKTAAKTVNGKSNSEIIIPINNPRLWSPDDPYLYDVKVKMGADVVKSYFGLRKVEIKKDENGIERIFLNNKYTYNLGTLDQGFWPDGLYTAPTDAALKFDIRAIKAMGFNTIRKHIKVEPARWYYHADKLGMLVWQDLVQPASKFGQPPSKEAKDEFEKESAEILDQLGNHPSITTWVLFNENWGAYDQERLAKWVKAFDPTRLVNGHSGSAIVNGIVNEERGRDVELKSVNSDMTDVHSYPLPAIPNHIDGKAMVLGEFGGIGVQVEGHLWDDVVAGWGYGGTVSPVIMAKKYAEMVDSLVAFEKHGLSASIYTQPYDVESEQNGLMTYDRELLKMPADKIRAINSKLWPVTANYLTATEELRVKVADTSMKDYVTRFKEYEAGKRDSASVRALALMASVANDRDTASRIGAEYIKLIKKPLCESNIKLIQNVTYSSKDPGYAIILNNLDKIKTFMDPKVAAYKVQGIIYKEQVKQLMTENPDWNAVDAIIKNYPQIDGEFVLGNCVVYYRNATRAKQKNGLRNLITAATIYDDRYHGGAYNAWAWAIFENSNDTMQLNKGLEWSHKSLLENPDDANNIDTYAMLLYKLGRKEEAIEWEQKAAALDPNFSALQERVNNMKENKPISSTP